jgi:toxin ParE1/3/4
MTRFEVLLTADAERDLEDLYSHIANADSRASADRVLDRLLAATESLSSFPERGSQPKELRSVGITEFRQVFFKPYRVIYRIIETRVVIYLIADGRRDLQELLSQRLLRSQG